MTTDIFNPNTATVDEARNERARRAVRAFRAMQPGLSGYARAITGRKDISVELDSGSTRTDGKKIYFCPPIELGDYTPHQRDLCEKRDNDSLKQLCPACRNRETVLIQIYHEIAHNLYGTFKEPSERAKSEAMKRAIEEAPSKFAEKIRDAWDQIPERNKRDYINLSALVSPFLPTLVNALEDIRVDESMFQARKGTRVMFRALTEGIFREGVDMKDGTTSLWSERPLNSQIMIGIFVLGCGYKYDGWFSPEIEAALSDEELRELVFRADKNRDAAASYALAFPILARLRQLGFCRLPEEEPESDEAEQPDVPQDNNESGDSEQENDDADAADEDGNAGSPGTQDESGDRPSDDAGDGAGDSQDRQEAADPEDGSADQQADEGAHDGGSSPQDADGEAGGQSGSPSDEDPEGGDESQSSSVRGADEDGDRDAEPSEDSDSDGADSGVPEDSGDAGADGRPEASGEHGGDEASASSALGGTEDSEDRGNGDAPDGADQEGRGSEDADGQREDGEAGERDSDASGDELTDDVEPFDSGADDGDGGTNLTGNFNYGSPEEAAKDFEVFSGHDHDSPNSVEATPMDAADEGAVKVAIMQGEYFEKPSTNVKGVRLHVWGKPIYEGGYNISDGWADPSASGDTARLRIRRGTDVNLDIPESVLGPALLEMRRVLSDNARAKHENHLRSGKINKRVLGKRAWSGDDRLFAKKRLPGKKSYAVILGIDISGSTHGVNIALAKRAAMAQAELCARLGIDFAIYAHTAAPDYSSRSWAYSSGLYVDVYEVKGFNAPWNPDAKQALGALNASSENLDGHTVEFYRKAIEKHPATDKIILYYTDGKMPAANHDEELEILQREILMCKRKNIALLGVGIRTDSPRRHGLDTVEVEQDADVSKVVRHLQSALLHNR